MRVAQEITKLKRTGFFPAFLLGGMLAGAFPIVNMAARPENFIRQQRPALTILISANWQMIAMLNLVFVVIGACVMYHTEFSARGMQKMQTLPQRMGGVFAAKALVLYASLAVALALETAALAFCRSHWFPGECGGWAQLFQTTGYALALSLPVTVLSLLMASLCRNMWISLGAGVICIFVATVLPRTNPIVAFFPFALPFQTLEGADSAATAKYLIAAAGETTLFAMAQAILWKFRRDAV